MINFDTGRLSIRVRSTLNRARERKAWERWEAGGPGWLGGWGAGGLGAPNYLNGQKKIVLPGLF